MTINSANQVWVVTGANRGLGLGLVKALLPRPTTTVIGTVRNDEAAVSLKSETESVTLGDQSSLYVIQLDFSAAIVPERIREVFAATVPTVDHIDVLICNAGYSPTMTPAALTTAEDLRAAFEVNTIAPLLVFQAFWPLLQKSASAPKLITLSSSVGSISCQEPVPGGAYGPSKAAGNWLTKALHHQNEASGLIALALHPGWVQTRMGNFAAKEWNHAAGPPETVDNSVKGMLEVIDGATRETASGKFFEHTGQEVPW